MRFKIFFLLTILWLIIPSRISAAEKTYKNDYKVEYFIDENGGKLQTKVKFTVQITNLSAIEYVDKVGLTFPDIFKLHDISASDDKGNIKPAIINKDNKINITIAFNDPTIGQNAKNTFELTFIQDNLFRVFGNVWEVMLPTISNTTSYQVIVYLPDSTNKKISVSKPTPDHIIGNQIIWTNPKQKIIYALFGDTQYYSMNLQYHLENDRFVPVYQVVAFPPDTLYQKIYINSVDPRPDKVSVDEDGNYMARYYLKPKQKLDISFIGTAAIFVKPREDIIDVIRSQMNAEKKHLLSNSKYWDAPDSLAKNLNNVADIYSLVSKKFTYSYSKIEGNGKRLGAFEALQKPDMAVCTEFTDAFVSLARKKKIYAREIEGFGFTQDQHLRPLSLVSDVLHAWPEYYDTEADIWKPIDPTWENTSGIDYFSSFDLNHIVFAIHGKDSEYPYPAGSYKLEDSKDVSVNVSSDKPKESIKVSIIDDSLSSTITDRQTATFHFTLENDSNVYIWNTPIYINSTDLTTSTDKIIVDSLPPYGRKEYSFTYKSDIVQKKVQAGLTLKMFDLELYKGTVTIIPYYYKIAFVVSVIVLTLSVIYFLLKYIKRYLF